MDMPPAALSVDEWADVERTNWRTCFCCAVKNVEPCDVSDVSGCCKKLVNLLFIPLADVELLLLVAVVWVLVNFCTCFSATIFTVDWALSCCINDVLKTLWSHVDTAALDDDCKLWLRVLCALFIFTLTALDVVVVVDDLSSSSSFFSSPGAVTIYCGGSVSSTDIFVTLLGLAATVVLRSMYMYGWWVCVCFCVKIIAYFVYRMLSGRRNHLNYSVAFVLFCR